MLYLVSGMRCLATVKVAAASSSVVSIPPKDILTVILRITSYSGGGGIAGLRFNADATTTNYHTRHLSFSNATTPALTATNSTTDGMITMGPSSITAGRVAVVHITNSVAGRKICTIHQQEEATAQSTLAQIDLAYGEWFNTSAQITSIQIVTVGGQSMGTGSGMAVFGRNL